MCGNVQSVGQYRITADRNMTKYWQKVHISDVQCVDNHSTEIFKSFFGDNYIVQLVISFDKTKSTIVFYLSFVPEKKQYG